MTEMDIFFILWFFVLPMLGIAWSIIAPVFWFFIVPRVARMLTWKRFSKCSFHMVADDTGYVKLLPTLEELPEGVVRTERGWRFLPRRSRMTTNKNQHLVNIGLRKFVWGDMGKPLWYGYAGKVGSLNPSMLALLHESKGGSNPNPKTTLVELERYVSKLPKVLTRERGRKTETWNLKEDLIKMLISLKEELAFEPLTLIDPTRIKEVIPKMFTPSQIDALATYSEMIGMKKAGKQFTPLILGAGLIVGLLIFGIIALSMLG